MKRVALFSVTYHPFVGGAEIAVKEVTNRLAEYEFDLFTARLNVRLPRQERMGNVTVYRLGSGRPFLDKVLYPWRAARLARKLHLQKPYDLVHAVLETYAGLAALLFKRREPQVPYLLTLQSGDTDEFIKKRTWFWKKTYAEIYTKADRITAISSWLAGRARRYGARREDITIIPNATDFDRFNIRISNDERESIRTSWGAKEGDFVVITASRLVYKNGIDTLIESMNHLPDNVRLVIAGEGKDEKKLKKISEKFRDRVVFLGQVVHGELPKLLKSADAFVRPSRSEGFGNAFIEAMAAGVPVIATPVGGIVDFITVGETGLLASADEPREVAGAISILQGPGGEKLRKEISMKGESLVKDTYNWRVVSEQYKNVYQKLLTQKHVPES